MHKVRSIGMYNVAVVEEAKGLKIIINLFLKEESEAKQAFQRPHETVGVLIGMTSRSLHCRDGPEVAGMQLNKIIFHPGRVLTGSFMTPRAQKEKQSTAPTQWEPQLTNVASTNMGGDGACAELDFRRTEGTHPRRQKRGGFW